MNRLSNRQDYMQRKWVERPLRVASDNQVHRMHVVSTLCTSPSCVHVTMATINSARSSQPPSKLLPQMEPHVLAGHRARVEPHMLFMTLLVCLAQYMPKLTSLMTRHRFEAIASFLHVVTKEEEATYGNNPLKKIYPLHEAIRKRSLDLYQPLQQLSIDERMVKSKARSHLRQYIRNKPTKWGFKYLIIADVTGYTINFSLYGGSHHTEARSGKGLGYDVVMNLLQPFTFQGYQLYCDNFYSSPTLFEDLQSVEIAATGTLQKNRRGEPASVKQIHEALSRSDVPRGTGHYIREKGITYVSWKDNKCVTVISTAHPGSSECTAKRWIFEGC